MPAPVRHMFINTLSTFLIDGEEKPLLDLTLQFPEIQHFLNEWHFKTKVRKLEEVTNELKGVKC